MTGVGKPLWLVESIHSHTDFFRSSQRLHVVPGSHHPGIIWFAYTVGETTLGPLQQYRDMGMTLIYPLEVIDVQSPIESECMNIPET